MFGSIRMGTMPILTGWTFAENSISFRSLHLSLFVFHHGLQLWR